MKKRTVYCGSAGLVTGLGCGVELNFEALSKSKCSIKPHVSPLFKNKVPLYFSAPPKELTHEVTGDAQTINKGIDFVINEALAESGLTQDEISSEKFGLFYATTKDNIVALENSLRENKDPDLCSRLGESILPFAISLKIQGEVQTFSMACVSGTAAVISASESIQSGCLDNVLVVGADIASSFVIEGFSALGAVAKSPCKPFDAKRDGLSPGCGFSALVLSSDSSKCKAGIQISSYAINNDANHITGPSRDGLPLYRCLKESLGDLKKENLSCLLSHGTGTVYNDGMESLAFEKLFEGSPIPITGIKGSIGHTMGSAGLIEIIVAIKMLENNLLLSIVGLKESEFKLNYVKHLKKDMNLKHILSCNSGFGGLNASVLLSKESL